MDFTFETLTFENCENDPEEFLLKHPVWMAMITVLSEILKIHKKGRH